MILLYAIIPALGQPIKSYLHQKWQFRQAGESLWQPAKIPGNVHLDLINNGLIEDPFFRTNENDLQWIGEKDWEYQTTFQVEQEFLRHERIELIFQGLDTYADVYLNDSLLFSANNMFRTWGIEAKPFLKVGDNCLRIYFHSVFKKNIPKWKNAPFRLMAFANNDQADTQINMYSRKAGFHFGWDWGPRLVTCGIWRPVFLIAWNTAHLKDLQIYQESVSPEKAMLRANFYITAEKDTSVYLKISDTEHTLITEEVFLKSGEHTYPVHFQIEKPRLWWTNRLGEQHLYQFSGTIENDDQILDQLSVQFGIRKLEVIREKDENGQSLYIKLNDVPVFMKGANYIPQDNFQTRITSERYEHMIRSAAEANMNMLRIWGGGIYEDDIFYELCDRYGILVWQDFMFACAMYPADEEFLENVRQEILQNVRRLRNHPSIALYCGNNENEISWYQWEWKSKYSPEVQKIYEEDLYKLFYQVIPDAVKDVDPDRYYHPTSPNTGYNDIPYSEGDVHYWGVWHGRETYTSFRTNIGRFMSEYGFQSFPEMSTIEKFTLPEDHFLDSEVMLSHQRCMADNRRDKQYGNRLIKEYMSRHYHIPKDFSSFLYVTQILQAEGVKMAIEAHRRHKPFCMGSLYWQIDDCWPVASWSSIDYFGNWKALHYFVKHAYNKVLISPVVEDDILQIFIISDLLEPIDARMVVEIFDFNGVSQFHKIIPVSILANVSNSYFKEPLKEMLKNLNRDNLVLKTDLLADDQLLSTNLFYFSPVKDLNLPDVQIKKLINEIDGGYKIILQSRKLAKNVYLYIPGINGFFTDNFFDLLPGIDKKINFHCTEKIKNIEDKLILRTILDTY
jgi:beta-mannosidase